MQEVYLCLDVGGTEIKAAPLDKRGNFLAPVRHFPAMAGADRQTLLENFGWIFSSICPEMLFPLKLILRFRDRLTIKTASAFYKGWTNTMHCTAAICAEHSPKSAACWSKKFNSSMMQRPLRWGKWPLVRRRKPGELCL